MSIDSQPTLHPLCDASPTAQRIGATPSHSISQNRIPTTGNEPAPGPDATQITPSQLLERIRTHVTSWHSTDEDMDNDIQASTPVLVADNLDIPLSAPREAHDPIRAVHLTLRFLLDNNTQFPEDPRFFFTNLMDLYGNTKTYALVAAVLSVAPETLTPRHIHHFFARLAWLNEASIKTDTARKQLDNLLFGENMPSTEAARLGKEAFFELGELLAGVPSSLQMWMLQFKRGQRRDLASDWLAQCPAENLLQGLTAYPLSPALSALASLVTTLEELLPTTAEYEDKALILSRNMHLTQPMMKLRIKALAAASQIPTWVDEDRSHDNSPPVEWSKAHTQDLGVRLLRKVALHAVHENTEAWVKLTLENAQRARGMQAFSFANKLKQVHPSLSRTGCLRLASLLLPLTPTTLAPSPLEPLPDSRALMSTPLAFNDWSDDCSIDELFTNAGFELLCERKQGKRHLLMPAPQAWQLMMRSLQFADVFRPLLGLAGWYGASVGESASPRATQALASRAIIDHFLGPRTQSNRSMAEEFQGHWVSEYNHLQLRKKISNAITERNPGISPAALELLEYLLLREIAPELLVTGTPDWLYYGRSLQSVTLIHGARLLEAMMPGASCRASFDKVVTLASDLSASDDEQVQRHWSNALALPALRYAKAHGALADLTVEDIGQATAHQIQRALEFTADAQKSFADDASQLAMTPPDRKTLAEEQLSQAGVDRQYWDKPIETDGTWHYLSARGLVKATVYTWHHTITTPGFVDDVGAPSPRPIIENLTQLVMSGDLYRAGKSTVPTLYEQAFASFKADWQQAHARLIKRLFMELPQALRTQLYTSTCEVSRAAFNTPSDSEEQTGIQGLFIRCQPGDHREDFDSHDASKEYFFELTPSAGALRPCNQQFSYRVEPNTGFSGNIVETMDKHWGNHDRELQARATPLHPLDSDAYLNGTPSRLANQLQTPRKGKLIAASRRVYAQQASEADFFQALATTATAHLYASTLAQFKADHTHTTPWEEMIALEKKIAEFLARAILPFYGCISDLAEGDHSAGVIAGCVTDSIGVLIPAGKFIASSATVIRTAGRLSLRASCEAMSSAIVELVSHLAQQSPALVFRDMGRLARWLSVKSWEKPALRWLHDLRGTARLVHMTQEGAYSIALNALSERAHPYSANDLMQVGNTENCLVQDLGTPEKPSYKLLDPHDNLPYGPRLIVEGTAQAPSLTPLKSLGSISPGHYPTRIAGVMSEDGKISLAIAEACRLRVRYKGAGHYDIQIDGHDYHLDANLPEPCLTQLSNTPVSDLEAISVSEVTCRLRRDLEEASCTPFTKLISLPVERTLPNQPPLTRGQEISQAFEAREFHLERRNMAATDLSSATSLDLLVHEGKFCKWDHAPIKGTRPVQFTREKKLLALSAEQCSSLGLPNTPTYLPQINGRMSSERNFGLSHAISGTQAKAINPHVPVVELEQVSAQIMDRRRLRGLNMEWNAQKNIYVEVDNGKFYKTRQGPGTLIFTPVTDASEIDEYLRLSNQYRFVAERPGSSTDRDNIAKLLFSTLVEKREPGLQAWLAASRSNRNYRAYAQWCIDNNQRNEMLHYAENILSGERAQLGLIDETRSLISDWKSIAQRNNAEKKSTVETLNELLPIQGREHLWVPLTVNNIAQRDVAEMIARQMNNSNLAFASIVTNDGEKFVYYALAGGKRAEGLHLKPYAPGANSHSVGDTTYIDAGALMHNRTPDPDIVSLPVVRHSGSVSVRPYDRYLDSERLIATILKENHSSNSIYSIHMFTRMDTCRSCGAVVLPQLRLNYASADFWVTYLDTYPT